MNTTTQYKAVSVSLPTDIINKVDTIACESYKSRSDVIREALMSHAVPIYTPTKEEAKILTHARKEMQKGEVNGWDEFIHELED